MIPNNHQLLPPKPAVMREKEFQRLAEFIYSTCGIKLPAAKRTMLEARLSKRLRLLGLKGYDAYCDYLFSDEGMEEELVCMIDLVTTNKTEFFRESAHFDCLAQRVVPDLIRRHGSGMQRPFVIWSAGCSTERSRTHLPWFCRSLPCSIGGSDSSFLLRTFRPACLMLRNMRFMMKKKIGPVPDALKRKYLLRGKNDKAGLYRVVPELRQLVRFSASELYGRRFRHEGADGRHFLQECHYLF